MDTLRYLLLFKEQRLTCDRREGRDLGFPRLTAPVTVLCNGGLRVGLDAMEAVAAGEAGS